METSVIQILNNSDRSLSAEEIINKINPNYSSDDLKELIEILNSLIEKGEVYQRKDLKYMPISKSKYLKGKIELTRSGSGFLLLDGDDLYISSMNLKGALDGDVVLAEVTNERKYEGKVVRIIERNLGGGLGEVVVTDGKVSVKLLENKNNLDVVFLESDLTLLEGQIVKLKVEREEKGKIYVSVKSIVGHKNAPDIDILKIVAEMDIPVDFSYETIEEVKSIPSEVREEDKKGRVDLTDKCIFTIDGVDTKDIDDAISIEMLENGNFLLGVHIADVSYYVKEGSSLKKDAFERGNSVYLADRVIPMLPVELSNGICSLNPNVVRCATSCEMEIDKFGTVVNKKLFKSLIKSRKKMNYTAVNQVLKGNTPEDYKEFESTLKTMYELSKILKWNKQKRGAIDFYSTELKLHVDEFGKVTGMHKFVGDIAEQLIENFMVVANESVSTIMTEHGFPTIYRVHGMPREKKIKEFLQFVSILGYRINGKINYSNILPGDVQNLLDQLRKTKDYEILNMKLLRSMQKAIYDVVNIGHFGLASKNYTHFTSPIRRFSDLELHYLIDEFLFKGNKNYEGIAFNLPFITEHVSLTERKAEDCEYEVNDMKVAEYMEGYTLPNGVEVPGHIGEVYDGVIDGTLQNGFFVETKEGIEGMVRLESLDGFYKYNEELMGYQTKKKHLAFRIGDKVRVRCIGASKEERTVDFTIERGNDNGNNKQEGKI